MRKFNRIFHLLMMLVWAYTIYLVATMKMMPAMWVMAVGMFVESAYAVISNDKGC
ncbi:hypothetical protein [Fructobacillus durionis]|uniref:Uncharacterized protein n=1 Tax=Fructobacillus durionis TaxID=283737 RepID=A0A1I1EK19_9LACO|nr:hypothetical protein [Fructobacillus durionis]SFB86996.1 hypothetical protein SAMN05660453_0497 [Fructobacillus durionis]